MDNIVPSVAAAMVIGALLGIGAGLHLTSVVNDCKNYGQAVVGEYRLTCVKEK